MKLYTLLYRTARVDSMMLLYLLINATALPMLASGKVVTLVVLDQYNMPATNLTVGSSGGGKYIETKLANTNRCCFTVLNNDESDYFTLFSDDKIHASLLVENTKEEADSTNTVYMVKFPPERATVLLKFPWLDSTNNVYGYSAEDFVVTFNTFRRPSLTTNEQLSLMNNPPPVAQVLENPWVAVTDVVWGENYWLDAKHTSGALLCHAKVCFPKPGNLQTNNVFIYTSEYYGGLTTNVIYKAETPSP
ncbi:MAG: hypothetical protein U1F77_03775 [Kiritimatiellia bacterium]